MSRKTVALAGAMFLLFSGAIWASKTGFGVPQPDKQPMSVRENSARMPRAGHYRTRYFFVGGGIHGGK